VQSARKLEGASEFGEGKKKKFGVAHFSDVFGTASLNSSRITLEICLDERTGNEIEFYKPSHRGVVNGKVHKDFWAGHC
jgi:hypothetical protein